MDHTKLKLRDIEIELKVGKAVDVLRATGVWAICTNFWNTPKVVPNPTPPPATINKLNGDENDKTILETSLGPVRKPDQPIHKKNWLGLLAIFFFFIIEGNISNFLPSGVVILISFLMGVAITFIFTNTKLKVIWGTFLLLFIIFQQVTSSGSSFSCFQALPFSYPLF